MQTASCTLAIHVPTQVNPSRKVIELFPQSTVRNTNDPADNNQHPMPVDSVKSLKEDRRQKAAKIMIDPPYGLKSLLAMRFINQVSLEYLGEGM